MRRANIPAHVVVSTFLLSIGVRQFFLLGRVASPGGGAGKASCKGRRWRRLIVASVCQSKNSRECAGEMRWNPLRLCVLLIAAFLPRPSLMLPSHFTPITTRRICIYVHFIFIKNFVFAFNLYLFSPFDKQLATWTASIFKIIWNIFCKISGDFKFKGQILYNKGLRVKAATIKGEYFTEIVIN